MDQDCGQPALFESLLEHKYAHNSSNSHVFLHHLLGSKHRVEFKNIATIYDEKGDSLRSLDRQLEETRELLSKSVYILKQWRQLLTNAEALNQDYLKPLVNELKFVDEYCTYRMRDGLASLMRVATEIDPRLIPEIDFESFLRRCIAMNRLERWYALKV